MVRHENCLCDVCFGFAPPSLAQLHPDAYDPSQSCDLYWELPLLGFSGIASPSLFGIGQLAALAEMCSRELVESTSPLKMRQRLQISEGYLAQHEVDQRAYYLGLDDEYVFQPGWQER